MFLIASTFNTSSDFWLGLHILTEIENLTFSGRKQEMETEICVPFSLPFECNSQQCNQFKKRETLWVIGKFRMLSIL